MTKWLLEQYDCANNDDEEDEQQSSSNETPPYEARIGCNPILTGSRRAAEINHPKMMKNHPAALSFKTNMKPTTNEKAAANHVQIL